MSDTFVVKHFLEGVVLVVYIFDFNHVEMQRRN